MQPRCSCGKSVLQTAIKLAIFIPFDLFILFLGFTQVHRRVQMRGSHDMKLCHEPVIVCCI